jgi:D-glycero-D-manno-heptose 1,7-bisphosphate phosphatase
MSADNSRRAVFLDRDGTLIVEQVDLYDPAEIIFIEGAFDALRDLHELGFKLVVATNQSGIARGVFTLAQYRSVEAAVNETLAQHGIRLDGIYFCPHHPAFGGPCECRKPNIGMYQDAARNLGLDLADSIYVGDRLRDVQPGLTTGGWPILVRTGYGAEESKTAPPGVDIVENLPAAARLIIEKSRATP